MTQPATLSTHRRCCAWPLAALCAVATGLCTAAAPVMQDAATHEQLARQLRKTQQEDPMKLLPASHGEDPSRTQAKDLLSQSDILCFGGLATLLPKRAILLVPKAMAGRTQLSAGVMLMGWAEFHARNRGWITTVEVSRQQAEGTQPLAEDVTKLLLDHPNLVVATYQGGPISVLPPKPTPAPPAPIPPTQDSNP